jgi:ubiquinone/menaquinone biosynthesis C-methylase UbiE
VTIATRRNGPALIENVDPYDLWMSGRKRLIRTAARGLCVGPSGVVLDVAAGDGVLSAVAAATMGGRLITHDWGAGECAKSRTSGRRTVRGDVRCLSFPDGFADVTLAFEIIEHFYQDDARLIIDEIYRVTKPGGTLFLSTPNRYSLESWKELARYVLNGNVWNARDQTHVTLYSSGALQALLAPQFLVRQWYGYYLPTLARRTLPWTYSVTTNSAVANLSFLLLVVATRR